MDSNEVIRVLDQLSTEYKLIETDMGMLRVTPFGSEWAQFCIAAIRERDELRDRIERACSAIEAIPDVSWAPLFKDDIVSVLKPED